MLKKRIFFGALVVFLACPTVYASDAIAPVSLEGHRLVMSYTQATGQLKKKVGNVYYANLFDHTFYSALLRGTKGHTGYYSYQRVNSGESIITVEHPKGRFKGWSYAMTLHFSNPHLGTFDIVDHGEVVGTMHGTFELS